MTKKTKIGYKVVIIDRDGFYKSCVSPLNLRYTLNKKTYHRFADGGLAIFDTYEHACLFLNNYSDYSMRIFECEYKPQPTKEWDLYVANCSQLYDQTLYCSYYRNNNDKFFNINDMILFYTNLPKGTILCRWVKLTKEI